MRISCWRLFRHFVACALFSVSAFLFFAETADAKKPFYVIAHRVNDIGLVELAMERGANAIEIDIICKNGEFYVAHDFLEGYSNPLAQFLDRLRVIARNNKQLALVIFDIKDVCAPDDDAKALLGRVIMREARRTLRAEGVKVLYSVAKKKNAAWLINMVKGPGAHQIRSGEIFAIDQEDSFEDVGNKLRPIGMPFAYGNGIFVANPLFWINCRIEEQVAKAAAAKSKLKFSMVYIWTIRDTGTMQRMLAAGVDGIFVNPPNIATLVNLVKESGRYRLATRNTWK